MLPTIHYESPFLCSDQLSSVKNREYDVDLLAFNCFNSYEKSTCDELSKLEQTKKSIESELNKLELKKPLEEARNFSYKLEAILSQYKQMEFTAIVNNNYFIEGVADAYLYLEANNQEQLMRLLIELQPNIQSFIHFQNSINTCSKAIAVGIPLQLALMRQEVATYYALALLASPFYEDAKHDVLKSHCCHWVFGLGYSNKLAKKDIDHLLGEFKKSLENPALFEPLCAALRQIIKDSDNKSGKLDQDSMSNCYHRLMIFYCELDPEYAKIIEKEYKDFSLNNFKERQIKSEPEIIARMGLLPAPSPQSINEEITKTQKAQSNNKM